MHCSPPAPSPASCGRDNAGREPDFHAGEDCSRVGERTTREMVELAIDKVKPDSIQIDGKGHRGYSSYPTKAGKPGTGLRGRSAARPTPPRRPRPSSRDL